mgnify:CR=1 FL=1
MLQDRFFWTLFAILALVALVHLWGLYDGGYVNLKWLDFVTHFLGGAWGGGIMVWLLRQNARKLFLRQSAYLVAGIAALFIGVGWEIFEIFIDPLLTGEPGYISDSLLDLTMDAGGGISAAFLFLWFRKKK